MSKLDVVVYGATGYTGRLVAEYLARTCVGAGAPSWGLAGRSADKLHKLREALGAAAADIPLIVADSDDPVSLRAMCERTTVVLSTAGPFQLHGGPVVAACVETGTGYVDISGEVLWIRDMIIAHHEAAKASGARIVPACGFDCVPFDLAVQMIQEKAIADFGAPASRIRCLFREIRGGGVSGGSFASQRGVLSRIESDPMAAEHWRDPFAHTPGYSGAPQPEEEGVQYDDVVSTWVVPFITLPMNSKIIHRSNLLLSGQYGADFLYGEMMACGDGEAGEAAAIAVLEANRKLGDEIAKTTTLKSGDGPTREERDAGGYDLLFVGQLANGKKIDLVVTGDSDLGYGSTSKIVAESALCLARSVNGDGGLWTPAALMGSRLRERLIANAGLTFNFV